jgi:tellurite resistance protein TerC
MSSIANTSLWLIFGVVTLGLLALDLFVFNRRAHATRTGEALAWSIVWVLAALAFNGIVYWRFGPERGVEFLTGYVIEKALAVDNLFVFAVIFSYFRIPEARQHRVLFWGVIGALAFRAVFVWLGAALLAQFHWIAYIFGAFLVFTGIKLLQRRLELHPEANPLFRLLRRIVPVSDLDSDEFLVRRKGALSATPLLLALLLVEITDVVFAIDSIPAIFAVTADPFIVFTSNIFAVLGLRVMYSLLVGFLLRLRFLHVGLALVLAFVGSKMLLTPFFKIPVIVSLVVTVALIGGSAAVSVLVPDKLRRSESGGR